MSHKDAMQRKTRRADKKYSHPYRFGIKNACVCFFIYNSATFRKEFFVSISTGSKNSPNDEIDLIPLIQALWTNKITILATTVAGVVISLSLYLTSSDEWTASAYITKSSLYNLYKEVNEKGVVAALPPQQAELQLYRSIQSDIFYTAMAVMASQSVALKEAAPTIGRNEAVLLIASATGPSAEQARSQLNTAMDTANSKAIALNLSALAPENSVKAFNTLDEIKITNSKNNKKPAALGAFLGLFLGSVFVIGRFLIRQYKNSNHA